MAPRNIALLQALLTTVMVTLLRARTSAQPDCTSVLITMAPCLDYVTGNSSTPTAPCCSQFGSVVQLEPRCLCVVLNGGGASLGISINQTLALALPQLCHVKTPPPSKCKEAEAADGPATSIAPSGTAPSRNSSTSGAGGSKTNAAAAAATATTSAVIFKMGAQFILLLLLSSLTWAPIFF